MTKRRQKCDNKYGTPVQHECFRFQLVHSSPSTEMSLDRCLTEVRVYSNVYVLKFICALLGT